MMTARADVDEPLSGGAHRVVEDAEAGPRAAVGAPPARARWPGGAPDLEVAEQALRAVESGVPPPDPALAAVAERVAEALSDFERRALTGAPLPVDAAPIRRAAAMRVRVGVALATAPPLGSSSDAGAVADLLAEIDGLLSEVNAIAADASPAVLAALGGCRAALVREAIDFSEAGQRYVPVTLDPDADARRLLPPEARVRPPPRDAAAERRARAATWILVLAAAAAAAAWGWLAWTRG